jgi:hypothetical protein
MCSEYKYEYLDKKKIYTFEEWKQYAMKFFKRELLSTPFHHPLDKESELIFDELKELNGNNFITMGSQPAVKIAHTDIHVGNIQDMICYGSGEILQRLFVEGVMEDNESTKKIINSIIKKGFIIVIHSIDDNREDCYYHDIEGIKKFIVEDISRFIPVTTIMGDKITEHITRIHLNRSYNPEEFAYLDKNDTKLIHLTVIHPEYGCNGKIKDLVKAFYE